MDFALTDEQRLIVDTTRAFVEAELYPREAEVERTGVLRRDLIDAVKAKAIAAGLYAANIPAEFGGAGLDTLTWLLYKRELCRASYALHWTCVAPLEHPVPDAGAAREVPRPLSARRHLGLPGDDRARRRLRPARHEGDRPAGRHRLGPERY
jgi:alkylation response protein AidB-like acyl-CoA dehydrogenase